MKSINILFVATVEAATKAACLNMYEKLINPEVLEHCTFRKACYTFPVLRVSDICNNHRNATHVMKFSTVTIRVTVCTY